MNDDFDIHQWDSSKYLRTDEDIDAFLQAAFEEEDTAAISFALKIIAKNMGFSIAALSKRVGIEPSRLYRELAPDGHPKFSTIFKVSAALGIRITASLEEKI